AGGEPREGTGQEPTPRHVPLVHGSLLVTDGCTDHAPMILGAEAGRGKGKTDKETGRPGDKETGKPAIPANLRYSRSPCLLALVPKLLFGNGLPANLRFALPLGG